MQESAPIATPTPQPALSVDVLALVADSVICTDEDGLILVFNPAAELSFGYRAGEVIGQSVELLLPQVDRPAHVRHVRGFAKAEGAANRLMGHRREIRGRRKNGQIFPAEATVSRQMVDGRIILTVVHRDITERKELETLREAAARELDHRMKNLLSIVGSLVAISAASAASVEDFQESLTGRLKALAATQGALRSGEPHSATLGELLLTELAQYRTREGANVVIEGPPIPVGRKAAQLLALTVHELATNAAKYGALSVDGGRVTVTYAFDDQDGEGPLVLEWKESGGPPVRPPIRHGFGTRLIKKVVARALRAEVAIDYRPDGLLCRLIVSRDMLDAEL